VEPGAAATLLEDVADRALRSEFKPDDGAGAGVVAEAVGDQSAPTACNYWQQRCDEDHDAFSQLAHGLLQRVVVSLQEAMRQLERVTDRLGYRTPRCSASSSRSCAASPPGLPLHLLPCRDHGG
jgi:hypothetical protein